MDMASLVEMRQSNWYIGSGAGPWVSILCFLQDTRCIFWFPLISKRKKQRVQIWDSTSNKSYRILWLWYTETLLRGVDLEPSPKRGSDKINMVKQGRKTPRENKLYPTSWTHIWISALTEVLLSGATLIR